LKGFVNIKGSSLQQAVYNNKVIPQGNSRTYVSTSPSSKYHQDSHQDIYKDMKLKGPQNKYLIILEKIESFLAYSTKEYRAY